MRTRPLIGCATYRKTVNQDPPTEVYGLMPAYSQAVLAAGGLPVLIPLGLERSELRELLQRLDGILIPGGGDVRPGHYGGNEAEPTIRDVDNVRDDAEFLLIRQALERQRPLLAICRGLQVMNVALGGTLWEDVTSRMPGAMQHDRFEQKARDYLAHEVKIQPGSLLQQVLGTKTIRVNSMHHQGIRTLAPVLSVSAVAPDNLIEAVEVPGHPFALGVQWHPENMLEAEPRMSLLFRGFVEAAANGGDGKD